MQPWCSELFHSGSMIQTTLRGEKIDRRQHSLAQQTTKFCLVLQSRHMFAYASPRPASFVFACRCGRIYTRFVYIRFLITISGPFTPWSKQQTGSACLTLYTLQSFGCCSSKWAKAEHAARLLLWRVYIQSGWGKFATIFWQGEANRSMLSHIRRAQTCSQLNRSIEHQSWGKRLKMK